MSFGIAIGETDHQYLKNAPASYVWVNGFAHLIVMVEDTSEGEALYFLRDYAMTLESPPGLGTTNVAITKEYQGGFGSGFSWDPGTPTAVYDPLAKQLLYLYVDINGNVVSSYASNRGVTTWLDARGKNFAVITTPDGFIVVTAADDWSEIYLTPFSWQLPPLPSPPNFVQGTTVSVATGSGFDTSAVLRGAVVMSRSSDPAYDYTLVLGMSSSNVSFAQIPINLDPLEAATADGWSTTSFTDSHLSGLCIGPDGLPIGLLSSSGSVQFMHYSLTSGWSETNPVGWESSGTTISALSGADASVLSLGYYFVPTANSDGASTDVYQLIVEPGDRYYSASIEAIGTLTQTTPVLPQQGNQMILLGIVEGPPPVPVENMNLPVSVSNPGTNAMTAYSYTTSDTTSQTISNTEGYLLKASGESGFGVGVQFDLEFNTNFSQIVGDTTMNTNVNSEQLSLVPSGSVGQWEVSPTGWLVTLQADFGAYVYQFTDVNGNIGAVSYAQVYLVSPMINYHAYTINTIPDVDLVNRLFLPPTPGDLSTYYPDNQDAQEYYAGLALSLGNGKFLSDVWTVGGKGLAQYDLFKATSVTSTVNIDLKAMVGDKFGATFFANATVSAGFEFQYTNSQTTTTSSDVGLQVTVGPLPGTLDSSHPQYLYSSYNDYTVLIYQLAPDATYAQWLLDDLPGDSFVASLAAGSQPWKIVYLVIDGTVNDFTIPAPNVPPASAGWSGDLGTDSCPNPPWAPGFQVRYAVSLYGGTDPNNPDWESPKGAWTAWLSSSAYCRAILNTIPCAPGDWSWPNGIGRKVYRQFLGSSPEYICNIADNTTTTFVDPVSPGTCGA